MTEAREKGRERFLISGRNTWHMSQVCERGSLLFILLAKPLPCIGPRIAGALLSWQEWQELVSVLSAGLAFDRCICLVRNFTMNYFEHAKLQRVR